MKKIFPTFDRFVTYFAAFLMGAMLFIVCFQVFTRKVLGFSLSWTEELARFLLIWITFVGSALAVRNRAHMGILFFVEKFNVRAKQFAFLFSHCCIVFFSTVIMIYGGKILLMLPLIAGQYSSGLHLKYAYIYTAIVLGGLLNIFYAFRLIAEDLFYSREFVINPKIS